MKNVCFILLIAACVNKSQFSGSYQRLEYKMFEKLKGLLVHDNLTHQS